MAIEPCPEIEAGPGRVVTGVFRHSRGVVYDLWVEGGSGPIGVTAGHPFWSVDRNDWVSVGALRVGERLQCNGYTALVLRIEPRGEEPVYNLEVDADHCYRVGEQGILVHNASGETPCEEKGLTPGQSDPTITEFDVHYTPIGTAGGTAQCNLGVYKWKRVDMLVANLKKDRSAGTRADDDMLNFLFGKDNRYRIGHYNDISTDGDNTGHIIPQEFGGRADLGKSANVFKGKGNGNVFPQSAAENTDIGKRIEGIWRSKVPGVGTIKKDTCEVCIRYTFRYMSVCRLRPSWYQIEWWLGSGARAGVEEFTNTSTPSPGGQCTNGWDMLMFPHVSLILNRLRYGLS